MQNPQYSQKNRRVLLAHFRRFFWHSFLTHIFTWRLIFIFFKISSWGHFSDFFFLRRLRTSQIFFFWGSRRRPGAPKCVRGVVFLHSSGSLLTSFLDPKNLPKLALLNFFKFISSDFIASLKFSKNSRGQLGPQEGPGRPLQEAKNRSKNDQKPSSFRDAILDPKMAPKWSKKHQNAKNPMDFHFASSILPFRRAVFRHPYRGFALALSKTHYVFTIVCAILH